MSQVPSRCPHCQVELPERGRFCVMCGGRIEGWGGLVVAAPPEALAGAVPLPSQTERTRPSAPPRELIERSAHPDQELLRPTMELPSVGHEVRSAAPDHRVHTSPTGNLLPSEVVTAVTTLPARRPVSEAPAAAAPAPASSASPARGRAGEETALVLRAPPASARSPRRDGVPTPMGEDQTDVIRVDRRKRRAPGDGLQLGLMALLCGAVAVVVGFAAYRLMTRPAVVAEVVPSPASAPGVAPAAPRPAPAAPAPSAAQRGLHRTRDLVVSIPPPPRPVAERRRGPNRPAALPPAGPTTSTTIDPTHPGAAATAPDPAAGQPGPAGQSAPAAGAQPGAPTPAAAPEPAPPPPPAPLSPEEQQREAEAQLAAADIEFVASTHNVQVRQCYERAFKDSPSGSPGGKVELGFTLSAEGRAVSVSTVVNTTGSERLARCLEQRIAEWRFPRPVGGPKSYQFPFVFLASEAAPAPAEGRGAAAPGGP